MHLIGMARDLNVWSTIVIYGLVCPQKSKPFINVDFFVLEQGKEFGFEEVEVF